jgi:acetophenone carboxylase
MPLDFELVRRGFRPDNPSGYEVECMKKLDPVDFSIYTRRLELACYESREVLKQLGISTFIQAGDTAHSIYAANGDLAIAEVGTYLHVVDGILPIKYVLKHFAKDSTLGIKDGDVFFCNEAIYGGIHNPDQIVFLPVFYKDKIICWVSAASHEPETGAIQPGGMPTLAKTRYDEGLKVPPIKIGENFTLKRDILDLFENNVRYPLMISNDTIAKLVACLRLRDRILEIVEKKGEEFLIGLLRKIIITTADTVKERIKKIPDGKFRHVAFLDTIGTDEGLIRLPVTLIKEGERMTFDLTHASPQVPGSYNAFQHMVEAHFASLIFQYFLNDIPASAGCLVPFEFKTTKGSILNADLEAAVSNVTYLVPFVVNAMQVVLIKAMFSCEELRKDEYISLPFGSAGRIVTISGKNQWGKNVTNTLIVNGNSRGGGARLDKDGIDSAGFWFCGYATASDCELEESSLPLVTLWRSYAVDQGGPGKFRGGTGVSFGWMIRNVDKVSVAVTGTGSRFPPTPGVFGGYPSSVRPLIILRNVEDKDWCSKSGKMPRSDVEFMEFVKKGYIKGELLILPNQSPTIEIGEGSVIVQASSASSGYGDVLERDPNAVIEDLKMGKISEWAARHVYKVVYNPDTLEIDYKKTAEEREAERRKRVERGKRYEEFIEVWQAKKPPYEALKYYGAYPIPQILHYAS